MWTFLEIQISFSNYMTTALLSQAWEICEDSILTDVILADKNNAIIYTLYETKG